MNWFQKPTPKQERENLLLRQWRQARLQTRLEFLPVELMLKVQCRSLAATQPDATPRNSNSRSILQRVRRNVAKRMRSASDYVGQTLSRRRCLQPLRRLLVQSKRRLTIFLLVRLLRLLRWELRQRSRGTPSN